MPTDIRALVMVLTKPRQPSLPNRRHPARPVLAVKGVLLPRLHKATFELFLSCFFALSLKGWFGNDGHCVSIGKKTILLFDCFFIAVKEGFSTTQGGYQKHQG
jgi:hypothetical protein